MIDLGTLKIGVKVDKDGANKELEKIDKTAKKTNDTFKKLAKVAITAFSVKAIVGFGKKAVEASADLQAMGEQFDQIFKGEENTQALDRINAQVGDLGIHADRLTESWNSFGGQVKGAGMDATEALEATDKATRLAADSAAFYDRSLEDSSASLASFMKGNFEAGDAIGVFTNAKQMDVRSNEKYGKSWADLTESERQWLLLETVEKTYEMNGAMGQASREADAYENTMGNLRATFKRLYATIGEPILEIFLEVVQKVTKWIEDNMPIIETTVKNIFTGIKEVWNVVLKPVLTVLWDVLKGIVKWVVDNWPTIKKVIEGVFDGIKFVWNNVLEPVLSILWEVFKGIVGYIVDNFPAIKETISTVFEGIMEVITPVIDTFNTLKDAIGGALTKFGEWVRSGADKVRNVFSRNSVDGSHANGLDYVPYNGYVAELHKGERVLTAKENQEFSNMGEVVQAIKRLENTLIEKNMSVSIGKDTIGQTAMNYARERNKITGDLVY